MHPGRQIAGRKRKRKTFTTSCVVVFQCVRRCGDPPLPSPPLSSWGSISLSANVLLNKVRRQRRECVNVCASKCTQTPPRLPPPPPPSFFFFFAAGQNSFIQCALAHTHTLARALPLMSRIGADKSGQLASVLPVRDSCSIVSSLPAAAHFKQYLPHLSQSAPGPLRQEPIGAQHVNLWHA